jgi:long-chain fatty acid transport protein
MLRTRFLLALAGVSLWAPRALASGFSVARFGGEAGHPTADNPTVVYYNPAALTQSDDKRLFLDLNVAYRRLTYDRHAAPSDVPPPPDAPDANTGRATLSNVLAAPTLGVSGSAGPLSFGLLGYVPFGAPVSWEPREKYERQTRWPGPVDGVQRWHSIEGSFITFQLSGALAHRFEAARLSVGLTLSFVHTLLEDVRARADGTNDVEQEGRSLLSARGSAIAGGAGLLWEAVPGELVLGASYQSRPNFSGEMTLSGSVDNRLGTESTADVDVTYALPDVFRLGARYRPEPEIELRLFGDFTRWSAFERQCIVNAGHDCELRADGSQPVGGAVLQNLRRDFHDTFELRAGMSRYFSSGTEYFAGVGLMTSAVPDETLEAGLADFAGASFTLGGKTKVYDGVAVSLAYTQFVFAPRTVKSTLSEPPLPTRQPDASGTYKQFIGVANANVDFRW